MRSGLTMVLLFLLTVSAFPQRHDDGYNEMAYPSLGWDSLMSRIGYPEIARRTGLEGTSNVEVHLDSVGGIVEVNVTGNPAFHGIIEDAVRSVDWQPTIANYKVRPCTVYFDVEFRYKNAKIPKKRVFVIETDKP